MGPLIGRLTLRAGGLWLVVRLVMAAYGALPGPGGGSGPAEAVTVNWPTSLAVILVVVALVLVDVRRREERIFLADLGISRRAVVGLSAAVTTALEVAVWALAPLLAGGTS